MKKNDWILIVLVLLKFALPFLLSNPAFELHRDEYLYFEQGKHPGFGYLENPSMIGILAAISSFLGGSFFWIKFWPALFGAFTMLITIKITRELGGNVFAQVIASLGILFSAYLRIHFLFQPNFLDIFFWTLSAYYLLRYINTKDEKYFFFLAVSLALGWWSKYSILFFIAALLLSIVLSQYRSILTKRKFWIAAALCLLAMIPNIIWQYVHQWPLVHHMDELRETQLRYLNKMDYLKEQVLMLFPVVFVWIGGLAWLLRNNKFRIIGFIFLACIILIMLGSGKAYYALGAYPMILAAGGVWAEKISFRKRWLQPAFIIIILLISLPFIPILLPMRNPQSMALANKNYGLEKLGLLKWEDQKNHLLQQDFADMLGWKELAEKTEKFFNKLPDSIQSNTIVFGDNYGIAGSLKYYAKNKNFSLKVISTNGSFLLWMPGRVWFRNLILIIEEIPDSSKEPLRYFERKTIVDSCTNQYSRQLGTKILFFQNLSDSGIIAVQKEFREKKAQFGQ